MISSPNYSPAYFCLDLSPLFLPSTSLGLRTGGGRAGSPSEPPALVALNLRLHRKAGRLGDATLPVPTALEV